MGKIHIYSGDMDNDCLNNAVYFMEEFLESDKGSYSDGVVDYGDRAEQRWNGDPQLPGTLSRLSYGPRSIHRLSNASRKSPQPG